MDAGVAIEVAEAGLLALPATGPAVEVPAVALIEGDTVVTGAAAAATARLKPVFTSDRFLADLSQLPLPQPSARARTTADLAWATVAELVRSLGGEVAGAVAALPSHWRGAQAGLFVAVARAAGLPLTGLVDAAVAATAVLPDRELLYLDIDLHQARVVRLGGADRLQRLQVEFTPRVGLKALHAAWAQAIAETFVRRTRFDPLHDGASEQRLHAALPGWLRQLRVEPSIEVGLEHGGGTAAVPLSRDQLLLASEAWYTQVVELVARVHRDGEHLRIALHGRAALPGLVTRLAGRRGLEPLQLADDAVVAGAQRAAAPLTAAGADSVCLALPRAAGFVPERAAVPWREIDLQPTHVMHAARAHAINATPLVVGRAPGTPRALVVDGPPEGLSRRHCSVLLEDGYAVVVDHSRHGTFLNGTRVNGRARLAAGDSLRLGQPGAVLDLVAVA
jgi:hypothetical protein